MDGNRPEDALVLRTDSEGVTTLALNRPHQRNALSVALMSALIERLGEIRQDPTCRVVILAGEGPAFCAGHDLKEMRANPDPAFYEALFAQCSDLMQAIITLPQPVIALVHGIATAAGCQLVATCDLAIAASDTKFATPGVNIGLFCSTPMVALTRNIGRKAAMEMLLTGEMVDAQTAVEIGLINRAVPPEALEAEVESLARKIAGKSALTVKIGKEAFYRQAEMPLAEAYRYTAGVMAKNMLAADAGEGIDAFLNKRMPVWRDC